MTRRCIAGASMWDLVRGATQLKQPSPAELGRRYTEMLGENLGQPGFRELLIAVHDLDAHRDLVFALVAESRRRDLFRRSTTAAADDRRAEVFDLSGVAREYLADAVAAALTVPVATDAHVVHFAPDGYWRGETHRCAIGRPASTRLLEELTDARRRADRDRRRRRRSCPARTRCSRRGSIARGRLGEYLQSAEAASCATRSAPLPRAVPRVFTIRPSHNPLGPFDFGGGYDDRSDRRQPLRGADEPRLRRRVPPVHRAGRRRERRTGRTSFTGAL